MKGDLKEPGSPGGTKYYRQPKRNAGRMRRGRGHTELVPVSLYVPMSVDVARIVLLDAGDFNLLETPLRQVDVSGSEVAPQDSMPETECRRQRSDLGSVRRRHVAHDLDLPMVLVVADRGIAITRYFVVGLGYWSSDLMRMQVASGLSE
jgi:hypothetical protein